MVLWKKVLTAFAQRCFIHVAPVHQNIRICHFSSLKKIVYTKEAVKFLFPFPHPSLPLMMLSTTHCL